MTLLSRLLAPFVGLSLLGCAAPGPIETARPGLWKVSDPDTTIYLFGTIHILPEGFDWRTPGIERAIASADSLVLEIADQGDPQQQAALYRRIATSPGLPPLAERVPADKRAELAEVMERAGFAEGRLDHLESWAAAISLGAALYTGMGMSAEHGVEQSLKGAFDAAGKPIAGLETTAKQLGYFDALPEAAQRRLLVSMIEEAEGANTEFAKMSTAWARGDTDTIAVTFDDELRISPELADVLIRKRNADWAGWIEKRLETPGTVLVAVGAGHLAGADSVQTMLGARGLEVERVQ